MHGRYRRPPLPVIPEIAEANIWVPDKRDALSGMTNSPLSVSPALRRDKANALRSPRSRPKRGAQGAGVSCGWLRALTAGGPGMRRGGGV